MSHMDSSSSSQTPPLAHDLVYESQTAGKGYCLRAPSRYPLPEAVPEPATSADCRLPDVRTDNQETPTAWSPPSEEEEAQSQKRRRSQEPVSEQSRPPTVSQLSPSQAAEIQLTATQVLELLQIR